MKPGTAKWQADFCSRNVTFTSTSLKMSTLRKYRNPKKVVDRTPENLPSAVHVVRSRALLGLNTSCLQPPRLALC